MQSSSFILINCNFFSFVRVSDIPQKAVAFDILQSDSYHRLILIIFLATTVGADACAYVHFACVSDVCLSR